MWSQVMKFTDPMLKLRRSEFRRRFKLDEMDLQIIDHCGMERIEQHAYKLIKERLANPTNDGKQTPYKGHPVFKAQHATATCCRRCLFKWHRVPRFRELTEDEVYFVVQLIMRWIKSKYNP